jgi:myosin heavy subunit
LWKKKSILQQNADSVLKAEVERDNAHTEIDVLSKRLTQQQTELQLGEVRAHVAKLLSAQQEQQYVQLQSVNEEQSGKLTTEIDKLTWQLQQAKEEADQTAGRLLSLEQQWRSQYAQLKYQSEQEAVQAATQLAESKQRQDSDSAQHARVVVGWQQQRTADNAHHAAQVADLQEKVHESSLALLDSELSRTRQTQQATDSSLAVHAQLKSTEDRAMRLTEQGKADRSSAEEKEHSLVQAAQHMREEMDQERKFTAEYECRMDEETRKLQAEFELLNAKIEENLNKIRTLTAQVATCQQVHVASVRQIKNMERECTALRRKCKDLTDQLALAKSRVGSLDLNTDKSVVARVNQRLKSELQSVTQRLIETEAYLVVKQDEWQQQVFLLQKSKDELEAYTAALRTSLRSVLAEMEQLENRCAHLSLTLQQRRKMVRPSTQTQHVALTFETLQAMKEEKTLLTSHIDMLQAHDKTLVDHSRALEKEIDRLRCELMERAGAKDLHEAKEKIVELHGEIIRLQSLAELAPEFLAISRVPSITSSPSTSPNDMSSEINKHLADIAKSRLRELKSQFGLLYGVDEGEAKRGCFHIREVKNGTAKIAGLLPDDIVEAINDQRYSADSVEQANDQIKEILLRQPVGEKVKFLVRRKDSLLEIYVEVGSPGVAPEHIQRMYRIAFGNINEDDATNMSTLLALTAVPLDLNLSRH